MSEREYITNAARALGDRYADTRNARLAVIERLLCGPLDPGERKELRREYLDLTDPKEQAA